MAAYFEHATAVAVNNRCLLIKGRSGSGKSSLALEMIALGARLVADDQVRLTAQAEGGVWAEAHENILGMIEARGLGLLRVDARGAYLHSVLDLNAVESKRLPEPHEIVICDQSFPLLFRVESGAFASMLMVYMQSERILT